MSFTNPFLPSSSRPGYGTVHLALLPPSTPVLQTVTYQYPLKLIAPEPLYLPTTTTPEAPHLIHTLFLLTYGGGLVAGDTISLTLTLAPTTRLILLTQGSTKIFRTPSPTTVSHQHTHARLAPGAALCYLPDPVQPFADSAFSQNSVYELEIGNTDPSLCILDWVCEGRRARGERWSFHSYKSKNEVWAVDAKTKERRLLLRDNQILDKHATSTLPELAGKREAELSSRMDGLGAFGTLILRGPLFASLGESFMDEFGALPRIGERKWEEDDGAVAEQVGKLEAQRDARRQQEAGDGVLWSAARVRGFVLVKFGAREVEGARRWVRGMVVSEGSVVREFGERAVLCLK